MSEAKLVLIDANSLLHRAFHAVPPLTTPKGQPINAVYGFAAMLLKVLSEINPTYVVVAWDTSKPTFRHIEYESYKAQRPETDINLAVQFEPARHLVTSLNIPAYAIEGYEADDIIGTLAAIGADKCPEIDRVIIVTGDLDSLQLVTDQVNVYTTRKGFSDTVTYTPVEVNERFEGLTPTQMVDYKALRGDPSDNIPGVKGVGEKTAIELLNKYKTLDTIYEHIDEVPPRQAKLLKDGKEMAYISRHLARIDTNVPLEFDLNLATLTNYDYKHAVAVFSEFGFKSLIPRLPKVSLTPKEQVQSGGSAADLNGLSVRDQLTFPWLDWTQYREGWVPKIDLSIAFNLLSGKTGDSLNPISLASAYLDLRLGDELNDSQAHELDYALDQYLKHHFSLPENTKLCEIYEKIEIPIKQILEKMSGFGITVDRDHLEKLHQYYAKRVAELEKQIYESVGHEFNLNSPKQIESVLFDELRLPVIRKTKTQRSTDEAVLSHLKDLHPVVELLMQYRVDFKIKSTYVDPLGSLIAADGRIHTTFNQSNTASGRVSSDNPNMQNIPVDEAVGLRRVFIAAPNNKLLVADYSQIELRIMAHLTEDPGLINSFAHNQDIHAATAARINDKLIYEVTPAERRIGKTINFALMYGMTPHGLSDSLGIPLAEAKHYIDHYFRSYPNIKKWQEELIEKVKQQGYVETLLGRRREVPGILSGNFHVRTASERATINHPLQGTQADILKMAMVEIDRALVAHPEWEAKMLLQVHDELVFEVQTSYIAQLAVMVKEKMESVINLDVPLLVGLKVGDNWQDLTSWKEVR